MSSNPLQQKLAATRQWWRTTYILRGFAWSICAVVLLVLVCYQSDTHLILSPTARMAWRALIVLAGLGVTVGSIVYSAAKRLPDTMLAAEVERSFPSLQERLLTTIELSPALALGTDLAGFSRSMTVSLAEETSKATEGMDFRRAVNTRSLKRSSVTAAFMVLLLLAQRFAAPDSFNNWLNRMRNPVADIPVWANTRVWVTPDKDLLPVGSNVNVSITTRGVAASNVTLYYRPAGDKNALWRTLVLKDPKPAFDTQVSNEVKSGASGSPDALQFACKLSALPASVEMYAKANDGRSNDKTVVVEPRPTLLNVKLTMHFPAYMHRATQVVPLSTGNIAAPVGTEVEIEASANKPIKSALYSRNDIAQKPWLVDGDVVKGHLSVNHDSSYELALTDTHGFENSQPAPRYEIHAIADLPPSVAITRPATDIDLVPDGSIPLVGNASDDYGVAALKLVYARQQADQMARTGASGLRTIGGGSLPLPLAATATQVNVAERWHIGSVHGKPGETIRYEMDAIDNDTLDGPHIGRSNVLNIHVRSLVDMQKKLKDDLDEEARALEQLRKTQIDAQHELHQARAKMDPAAITRAQEAQHAVAEEAKALTQRIADVSAQLENNNLATKSELDRRSAAQNTLDAVAQQKAPQAADAVQHAAAQKAAAQDRAESIRHADHQESEIRHDIEKAQDLLTRTPAPEQLAAEAKRLATEQERLADTARSLAEGIKEQKQQTNSNELSPELKVGVETERQQQEQANQDTQRLERQFNNAATAAEERGQHQQAEALKQAQKALKQANVAAQQAQAQQNLAQAHPEKAAPEQDRAAAGLEKAAQAAQQAASDTPNAANAAEQLEKAAQQLHDLAKQQQDVAAKTAQPNSSAQQNKDLAAQERNIQNQAAQQQQNLNGTPNAQQSLQKAQQNLSQSGQQLGQNQPQQAKQPAQQAAQNLENAARQAENAAQQIRQEQAANELADKVERLAQIQSALKNQTERIQNTRQTRPLNNNEKGELGQVAARQQNVEEEAKTLAERFPSPAFQKALTNAAKQAHPATKNLNPENGTQPDTGQTTQAAQARAAQTLGAVAQALKQQAQAARDQQQQQQQNPDQQSQMSPQQAQEAEALGELRLAEGLQQQLRQNTGQLDQTRHNQALTPAQQEQARQLAQDQQDTQAITNHAAETLSALPGVPESLQQAGQHMEQSHNGLTNQQTGQPTQGHQDSALQHLAQAQQKAQQAMQQQQQQQQAQQQAKQGAPQPGKQPGNDPDHKAFTRLESPGTGGQRTSPNQSSGRFANLSERSQRSMHEGQQEKVPAEFQDLVSRYYKSLAEKKR